MRSPLGASYAQNRWMSDSLVFWSKSVITRSRFISPVRVSRGPTEIWSPVGSSTGNCNSNGCPCALTAANTMLYLDAHGSLYRWKVEELFDPDRSVMCNRN